MACKDENVRCICIQENQELASCFIKDLDLQEPELIQNTEDLLHEMSAVLEETRMSEELEETRISEDEETNHGNGTEEVTGGVIENNPISHFTRSRRKLGTEN